MANQGYNTDLHVAKAIEDSAHPVLSSGAGASSSTGRTNRQADVSLPKLVR